MTESTAEWPRRALVALFAGAIGIAFAPILVEVGHRTDGIGPSAAAFWRLAFGWVLFVGWTRLAGIGRSKSERPVATKWLLLPGIFFAFDLLFWHLSFQFTNLANATLLANFSVVVVALAGWLLFRERFGGLFVVGAVIALGGTALLLRAGFSADPETVKGDLLGLATAIFYGSYLVSVKVLRKSQSTLRIMITSCWVGAPLLLVAAIVADETIVPTSLGGWLSMIGLAVVAHGGGQALIAYALATLPAAFSAVTLLIQPLTVALLQWLLFGQTLTPGQLVGGGVVLLGIFLARLGSSRRRQ